MTVRAQVSYLVFFLVDCLEVARPVVFAVFRVGFLLIPRARLTGSIALPVRVTIALAPSATAVAAPLTVLPIVATVVFPREVLPRAGVDLLELFFAAAIASTSVGSRPETVEKPWNRKPCISVVDGIRTIRANDNKPPMSGYECGVDEAAKFNITVISQAVVHVVDAQTRHEFCERTPIQMARPTDREIMETCTPAHPSTAQLQRDFSCS